MKIMPILICLALLLSGCAAPTMTLSPGTVTINPIGLFVCSSTDILDDGDMRHKQFVLNIATDTIQTTLADKYTVVPLNDRIKQDDVLKKTFGSFYIDEKAIAQIANQAGCSTCMIVYYSFTDSNLNMGAFAGAIISQKYLRNDSNMKLHAGCSLYGWLLTSLDAKVLIKSHKRSSFVSYDQNLSDKKQLGLDYAKYISDVTKDMFLPMVEDTNRRN